MFFVNSVCDIIQYAYVHFSVRKLYFNKKFTKKETHSEIALHSHWKN